MRTEFLAVCALVGSSMAGSAAEDVNSAAYVMTGCRPYIQEVKEDEFRQGICVGTVRTVVEMDSKICPPKGGIAMQAMRAVVQYIDSKPNRLHEPFVPLATEALRVAWACR
jgi:hypothetical protein